MQAIIGFMPDTYILNDPAAVDMQGRFIRSTAVCKNPSDYCCARDTYYVKSYNSTLIFLDKRIHYRNTMYEIRSHLGAIEWNENVDMPHTSRSVKQIHDHPERQLGKKRYKAKTFRYVDRAWELLQQSEMAQNV